MYVRYRNETYDITEFVKKHPGGSNTLNGMLNADIDFKFDKGMPHSEAAKYLMREYRVLNATNDDSDDRVSSRSNSFKPATSAMQLNNRFPINNDNNNNSNSSSRSNDQIGSELSEDDIPVNTDESMEVRMCVHNCQWHCKNSICLT